MPAHLAALKRAKFYYQIELRAQEILGRATSCLWKSSVTDLVKMEAQADLRI
jgi:hypothetical protein